MHAVTTPRSTAAIVPAPVSRHGDGLHTMDLAAARQDIDIAPFIAVSFFEMNGPTFPPHPHAGFSVATYIVPESEIGFVNQDSLGHRNRIPPGALHWTTAGSGVLHEEQPERSGALARGFQIWVDLPDAERERLPDARHLPAAEVPLMRAGGSTVRAVLGASNGVVSPQPTPPSTRPRARAPRPFASWRPPGRTASCSSAVPSARRAHASTWRPASRGTAPTCASSWTRSAPTHSGPTGRAPCARSPRGWPCRRPTSMPPSPPAATPHWPAAH